MCFGWFKRRKKKDVSGAARSGGREDVGSGTVLVDDDFGAPGSSPGTAAYTIRLSDLSGNGRTWDLPFERGLLIGRGEHCAVQFHDLSVSREQCRILVQNGEPVVVHLSNTNKTRRNGTPVVGSSCLHVGDILQFGQQGVRIDSIHSPQSSSEQQEQNDSDFDEDYTMSFF